MEYLPTLILSVIVCLALPVSAQDKELTEEQLASIQLPMDPEDPVFEYDSFGGMRMAVPEGFEATPDLQVYGDGKVVAGTSRPNGRLGAKAVDCRCSELTIFYQSSARDKLGPSLCIDFCREDFSGD